METERAVVVCFFYSAGNNSLMLNLGPNYNQSVHHRLVHKDVLTVFMLTQYLIFVIFVSLGWHFHAKLMSH